MMRQLLVVAFAVGSSLAWEPDEEAYFSRRELQSHSSGGHSSGGHSSGSSSGGHSRMRQPDTTKTGCTPKSGKDMDKTTSSSGDPVNEPCYVHDAACKGYPVCCVKKGSCVDKHGGMVSSNAAYYEGGCVSPDSSAKKLPEGCAVQGECHAMYLEHMKGATTEDGLANAADPYVVERMMQGAEGCESFYTPPLPIWVYILIGVGGVIAVVLLAVVIKMTMCKKKPANPKGGPPAGEESSA